MIIEYVSKNIESNSQNQMHSNRIDTYVTKLFFYLFTGTQGGINRLRILLLLTEKPRNAHQITKALEIDYKTVAYHLSLLQKNNLILSVGKKYGAIYCLSFFFEHNIESFNRIILKLYKEHKKTYKTSPDNMQEGK
ncbi:MAG: ArsR family transcriptional regulator [Thaumarchaeota archaeon]|nr:ArsR family transcriptional regulator [Nitrososphaerota archaeon]